MVKKNSKKRVSKTESNSELFPVKILAAPVKSESDKKEYKLITLANGLRALLVSDPSPIPEDDESCFESEEEASNGSEADSSESEDENDTSSGSESEGEEADEEDSDIEGDEKLAGLCLMIDVGAFSDPEKYQGLAHFLEHMIFMGSTKYPSESAFDNHIKKFGGFDNANTEAEETLFYFEICEDHLDSSIKRFVALFKDPLLKKTSMTRERDAIESEFVEVKQDDETRRDALLASVCGKEGHVSRSFGWGNKKSLKDDVEDDDDLHAKLVEFKNKYYFADRMYLCVQARASLEFLEDLVVRNFSELDRSPTGEFNDFQGLTYTNAFNDDFYNKVFLMKQVAKNYKLELTWCMPPIAYEYRVKPDHFVSFITGYEGKGSLVAYLRKKFWALDIVVGVSSSGFDSNSMYSLFNICIYLTETGFKHIKEITEATYAFLKMISQVENFETVYKELQCIEATTFRYQLQKPAFDNVQNLAINMKYYKPEDILNGADLYFEYDEQKIKDFIKFLVSEECNIMISSHETYENIPYDKTEKWFGVEYATIDKPNDWVEVIKNPRQFPEFFMIEPNVYISKDFQIFSMKEENEKIPLYPEKLIDSNVCELWFRQDEKFQLPHVCINIYFTSPSALKNAKSAMLTSLYGTMIKYIVVEELYPATCAGLDYSLYTAEQGVILKLHGYNEKIHIVAESIVDCMKNFNSFLTQENFDTYLLLQRRTYHNNLFNPKKLNRDIRLGVLEHRHFSQTDKYNLTWEVTIDDMKEFSAQYLEELKLKILIQGNYTKETAIKVATSLLKKIDPKEISEPSIMEPRTTQIPLGTKFLICKNFNPFDANTTVCNFYQIGPCTLRNECIMDFIKMLTDDHLFDTLRTKEQLGYDVSSSVRMNFGILAYSITVNSQEDKYTATHVEERIEDYRQKIISYISNMERSEFEHTKRSLIKIKRVVDNSLNEEVQRNWNEIVSEEFVFHRNKIEAECVATITKEEVIEFLMGKNSELRKISFQTVGNSKASPAEDDIDMEKCDLPKCMTKEFICCKEKPTIANVEEFKNTLFVYPRTKTLIDFQSNHLEGQ